MSTTESTNDKLLDHDFSIVKKVYYPNTWKLGIAYAEYKPNALSYLLYPIQISRICRRLHSQRDSCSLHPPYSASWKMIPTVWRCPERTRLTPCRRLTR